LSRIVGMLWLKAVLEADARICLVMFV